MIKLAKLLLLSTIALTLSIQQPQVVFASNDRTIEAIEKEAETLYEQNKFSQAIDLLETAIEQYEAKKDIIGSALATRNLALIYQKLGEWKKAEITLSQAENIIAKLEDGENKSQLLAEILEVREQIQLSLGQSENALETWKKSTYIYQQQQNITGFTQTKIYQAYALRSLGLYSQAIKTLTEIKDSLESEPNTSIKAQALLSLGNVLNRIGKYREAEEILKSSLVIAKELNDKTLIGDILLNLGNNARLKGEPEKALEFDRQAIEIASDPNIKLIRFSQKNDRIATSSRTR